MRTPLKSKMHMSQDIKWDVQHVCDYTQQDIIHIYAAN